MSKLVDKLHAVGKAAPQPMGFGFKATAAQKAKAMVLTVSLPRNDAALAKAAIENGADALTTHINVEEHTSGNRFGSLDQERSALEAILKAAGDTPVGIAAGFEHSPAKTIEAIKSMGFDFLAVYAEGTPAGVLTVEKIGRSLIVDGSYSDALLRTLNDMPFDMIEADMLSPEGDGQPLTVYDVLQYRKLSLLVRKPIIVPTQRVIDPADLSVLQEAGIEGVSIGFTVTGDTAKSLGDAVARFRKAIDGLKPVRQKAEHEAVVLPIPVERTVVQTGDDDE